jgi:hypothetical protein
MNCDITWNSGESIDWNSGVIVWADCVEKTPGGGRKIKRAEAPWPWNTVEEHSPLPKFKKKKLVIPTQEVEPELIKLKDEPIRAIFPELEPIKLQLPKFEFRPRKNDDDEVLLLL